MSGGVDSSTTAALLVHHGYEVIGITLQLYDQGAQGAREKSCCAGRDVYDARKVAETLDIPHYVLDYQRQFHDEVISEFADSYMRGETPIPCVLCNQTVKFRDLLATARDLGADALATGHYVRRRQGLAGAELHRAVDLRRDQSYFLFATTADQLDCLRFPLGDLGKNDTRALAARFALPVATKPDSQDICFVASGSYADVIARLRPEAHEPGPIVHVDGATIGRHPGVIRFTVGQRRGLGVAWHEPLYVVRIEAAERRVVVGPRSALYRGKLTIRQANWLDDEALSGRPISVDVKLRANQQAVPASICGLGERRVAISLEHPQPGISPGQACVIYRGDRVLGGGWIEGTDSRCAA
jgi:tRNA-specific 2-thiouridylase